MKAAILGMGAMGQIHKQVYESLGIEVETYDPKDDPLNYAAETISMADIVSICSPDNHHTKQLIAAFEMGKHVFCEKPLCHTRKEFEAIKAAYNKECALGMNFPLRWHKPFVEAKQRIPDLGEIYLVEADYEYGRLSKMTDGWRGQIDYDIVMGGGLHMIDVMDWMGLTISSAQGFPYSFWPISRLRARVSAGHLKEGAVFKLTCDFGGSKSHARRLRICGTKDSLYIDDREPTDKGRALREFLNCMGRTLRPREMFDVPTPEDIFRVHEIGLSL